MPDEPDDFTIPYMLLADAAEALGGKLYILGGGWDRLLLAQLPGRSVKPFAVAIGIKVPYSHTNRKFVLSVELVDADGNRIGEPLSAQLETGRPPGLPPGTPQTAVIAIGTNPEFPGPGRFSFVGRVDGQIKNNVAFDIVQFQMPFMPGVPPAA